MNLRFIPTPKSVRGTILLAFGGLIVITLMIVTGAVITVREYQDATSEMQKRANLASDLQNGQADASVAALLLQRYVASGTRASRPRSS